MRWVAETSAATGLALGVLAPEGERSPTVSAITLPNPRITARTRAAVAAARGYVIGDGYGKLKGRTFRIGHMGDHTLETLEGCLAACGDALKAMARGRARSARACSARCYRAVKSVSSRTARHAPAISVAAWSRSTRLTISFGECM